MEEKVGGHDGGYSPQVHPVPLLPGHHLTEELEEGLTGGEDEDPPMRTERVTLKHNMEESDRILSNAKFQLLRWSQARVQVGFMLLVAIRGADSTLVPVRVSHTVVNDLMQVII